MKRTRHLWGWVLWHMLLLLLLLRNCVLRLHLHLGLRLHHRLLRRFCLCRRLGLLGILLHRLSLLLRA